MRIWVSPAFFYNEDPPSVGSPKLADTFPTRGKADNVMRLAHLASRIFA